MIRYTLWASQKKCSTRSLWKTQKGKPESGSILGGFSCICASFCTLSNSPNKKTDASLMWYCLPSCSATCDYFLTTCLKMVWLMGKRSIVSSCFTSFRHMGHLTRRFLNEILITCRTWKGRRYRRCDRSGSWSLECAAWCRNFVCKACSCLCRATCSRTRLFIYDRDLEGFRPAWRRR